MVRGALDIALTSGNRLCRPWTAQRERVGVMGYVSEPADTATGVFPAVETAGAT